MAKDYKKDAKFFNCSEDHERKYMANRYEQSKAVEDFLIKKCKDGTIKYSTHEEVYALINKELGFAVPGKKPEEMV